MSFVAKVRYCEFVGDVCHKPTGKIKFVLEGLGMLDRIEQLSLLERRDLFAAIDRVSTQFYRRVGCLDQYLALNCGPLNTKLLNEGCTKKISHKGDDCEILRFRDLATYWITDNAGNYSTIMGENVGFIDTARLYKLMYDRYATVHFMDNIFTDFRPNVQNVTSFEDSVSIYYDILIRYGSCYGGLNTEELNTLDLNKNKCSHGFSELVAFLDLIEHEVIPYPIPPEDMPNDIVAFLDDLNIIYNSMQEETIGFLDQYSKHIETKVEDTFLFSSPNLTSENIEFNYFYMTNVEDSEAIFLDEQIIDTSIVDNRTVVGFTDYVYKRVLTTRAINKLYFNKKELN